MSSAASLCVPGRLFRAIYGRVELTTDGIAVVQGPMHLVTDPMTQDAKLVPLWRAMYVPPAPLCRSPNALANLPRELTGAAGVRARYADMSAQGETPKVETPDDWKIPGWN